MRAHFKYVMIYSAAFLLLLSMFPLFRLHRKTKEIAKAAAVIDKKIKHSRRAQQHLFNQLKERTFIRSKAPLAEKHVAPLAKTKKPRIARARPLKAQSVVAKTTAAKPLPLSPRAWTVEQPAVSPTQLVATVTVSESGCAYKITLDNIEAAFRGQNDSLIDSRVTFSAQEKSLICRGAQFPAATGPQSFTLTECSRDKHGGVQLSYASPNVSAYQVRGTGVFESNLFTGVITIERRKSLNQPYMKQAVSVHFQK